MSTFFERLQSETRPAREDMLSVEQLQRGVRGDVLLGSYVAFLTEAYHHVKRTAPLLMACGSRVPSGKEWVRNAIAKYIEEEIGHDEWILDDLEACGADREAVRQGQPRPATELMVSYAYDSIARRNPLSFFGMVLVLEGTSIGLATRAAGAIRSSLELPKQAFSYLTSHGSIDIQHMSFFEQLMNRVEEQDDQQAIIHMAWMMFKLYGDVFRSIPLN